MAALPLRLTMLPAHLVEGLRFGYPPCCIAHFLLDNALGRPSAAARWWQIYPGTPDGDRRFVPCGLWHAANSELRLGVRIARILKFQALMCSASQAGAPFRDAARRGSPRRRESASALAAAVDAKTTLLLWWDFEPPSHRAARAHTQHRAASCRTVAP